MYKANYYINEAVLKNLHQKTHAYLIFPHGFETLQPRVGLEPTGWDSDPAKTQTEN